MEDGNHLLCPKTHNKEQALNSGSSNGRDCAQNGANGRHLKKKKEKEKPVKIQQRGLGVAELEKLRQLEEQKSKGVVISSPVSTPQSANNLHTMSASVPLRPSFVARTRSPYHLARDNYYAYFPDNPHLNVGHQNATQLNSANHGICYPNYTEGNGNNWMSSEYTQELEISSRSAQETDGPNLTRPFPMQLGNQQSYFYSPSTVNNVAANSSSAVLNYQTEPPSNQSLCGTYRSFQPDEAEKIVGSKRQHLFSPHDPPDPIPHCKFNPFVAHSLGRSNSVGTHGSFTTNGNPSFREGLPCSMSMPNLQQRKDIVTDSANSDGVFLKLGSPATMSLLSGSKSKQAFSYAQPPQLAELPNLDSTAYQVHGQGSNSQGGSNISTNHHQQQGPHPTFLPASDSALHGESTVWSNHNNGDNEDNLDLSLKL